VGTEAPAPIRTFLIADVRGYTRFTEQHGDEVAARLAAKFADLVREGVETRGGSLVEVRGDEALAVFESARQAIRAAVDLQRVFVEETEGDPDYPLEVGIGIDSGEAVALDGGFRGAALNVAARLCALAHGGEIIASEGTTHLAGRLQGLRYIDRGRMHLKGVSEPVRGMNVAPEGEEPSSNRVFMFFNSPNRMGLKLGAVAAAIAAVTAGLVVYLVGENNPESSSATPPPPATSETPAGTPTSEEEVEAPDSLAALVPQQLWADCELQPCPSRTRSRAPFAYRKAARRRIGGRSPCTPTETRCALSTRRSKRAMTRSRRTREGAAEPSGAARAPGCTAPSGPVGGGSATWRRKTRSSSGHTNGSSNQRTRTSS
jgi:class 3 adenylate cyclase